LTFREHTTNLFQALDFVFFGNLQHLKATAAREFGDDSVNEQIMKMTQPDEQTATSGTVRGSFRKARMIPDTTIRPFKILIDEEIMRQNPGFQAVWETKCLD
jgi:hypothetical protein